MEKRVASYADMYKGTEENHSSFLQRFGENKAFYFWHYIDRLSYRVKFIAKMYERIIGEEYRKEIEKFNLSESKNILHIGCGAYPITAMVLAELDNVNIVTIDSIPKSVKYASKLISKRNLNDKIKAEYGEGTDYPLEGFDTIIISGCSIPKIKIIEHVLKNSKPNTRIIIRDTYIDIKSLVKSTNSVCNIEFVEKMDNYPFPTSRWDSYYFLKK